MFEEIGVIIIDGLVVVNVIKFVIEKDICRL